MEGRTPDALRRLRHSPATPRASGSGRGSCVHSPAHIHDLQFQDAPRLNCLRHYMPFWSRRPHQAAMGRQWCLELKAARCHTIAASFSLMNAADALCIACAADQACLCQLRLHMPWSTIMGRHILVDSPLQAQCVCRCTLWRVLRAVVHLSVSSMCVLIPSNH